MSNRWLVFVAASLAAVTWGTVAFAAEVPGQVGSFDHGNQYAWIFAIAMLIIVIVALTRSYRRMKREWRSPGS